MRRFADAIGWCAIVLGLPALASCSEYLDRRDGISLYSGDAIAGNRVVQMVDPWPRVAADRNISYDGAVIGRAVARYRAGKVIQPRAGGTSSTYDENGQAAQGADVPPPGGAGPVGPVAK